MTLLNYPNIVIFDRLGNKVGKSQMAKVKSKGKSKPSKQADSKNHKSAATKETSPKKKQVDSNNRFKNNKKSNADDKTKNRNKATQPITAKEEKGLVYVGALSRYLAEVRRHPLLTREEEYELAVRLHEEGDKEAAARLVTANLRLVVKIAMEYQRTFTNVLDLIQEGNIGLMQAVARFDPYRGVKLSSYASWWIKAYILRYILNNWRMVKVVTTQTQRKLFFNLQKEKDRLEAEGFSPTTKLLSKNLDVPEKDVIEMDKRLSQGELSLDVPLSDDSRSSLSDIVADETKLQDDILSEKQMANIYHQKLQEFEEELSEKQMFIYKHRMLAESPMTLQEIGDHFGITRERVRQIEARILQDLRQFFEEQGLKKPD